ncbi:MAG: hypothetical protein KIT09_18945 [Bryobacteraceae bacterium]|nr:hypothetical protein [Bryobacteraceae bacterium]
MKRQATEGQAKETVIGVEFFQRDPAYDPRKDPIVRVEAHRLRRRLREYYQSEGAQDPWQLELPAGAYLPVVRRREDAEFEWRIAVRVEATDPPTAEGLAAEVIRQLGTLRDLKVLGSLSSLTSRDSRDAVQQLGANSILECRLDGFHLKATLSRAQRDRLIPVASFDNLVQPAVDALTSFVASSIGLRRTGGNPRVVLDLQSYQLYLAGRGWFHRWSPDNLIKAGNCFEQVIARNPGFAPAYAGMADIQVLLAYWHADRARPVLESGLAYAKKALELDPASADAYCSRAALEAVLHYDWELAPQLRFAEAVDAVFAAYDLDPASPEIGNEIVWVRNCCGHHLEAAEQARRIVELHPGFLEAYWSLAAAESSCGNHAAATAALDRAEYLAPDAPFTVALRCSVEGAKGDVEAARQSFVRLDSLQDPASARAIYRAWAYAAIGDVEAGMQHLERAVDVADPHALYVEVFPPNARLRSHFRYPEILRRQRLPHLAAQPGPHRPLKGEPAVCI